MYDVLNFGKNSSYLLKYMIQAPRLNGNPIFYLSSLMISFLQRGFCTSQQLLRIVSALVRIIFQILKKIKRSFTILLLKEVQETYPIFCMLKVQPSVFHQSWDLEMKQKLFKLNFTQSLVQEIQSATFASAVKKDSSICWFLEMFSKIMRILMYSLGLRELRHSKLPKVLASNSGVQFQNFGGFMS